jgi:hypothetical protein
MHPVGVRVGDPLRIGCAAQKFESGDRETGVHRADDGAQPLAIGLNRPVVGFARREIAVPVLPSLADGLFGFAGEEPVNAGDHLAGEVALEFERFGLGQEVLGWTDHAHPDPKQAPQSHRPWNRHGFAGLDEWWPGLADRPGLARFRFRRRAV